MNDTIREAPVGRTVEDFATAVGLSRAFVYQLPPEKAPHSIKIGKRRIVTEAPAAWLARIAELQAQAS